MHIMLNGDHHTFQQPLTAAELVTELGLQGKRIAIEINQEILPRSEYSDYAFCDNDRVEIVNAIGGG